MLRAMSRRSTVRWVGALLFLAGCEALLTEAPDPRDLLDSPLEGLSPEEEALFLRGDENFGRAFTPEEGLGPIFVQASCSHCHIADGRGTPGEIVIRFSLGTDLALAAGGDQLQSRAIPGIPPETIPVGSSVSLRLPPPVFGVGLIEAIPEAAILAREDPGDADLDGISGRANRVEPENPFVPESAGLGRFGRKANFASLVGVVGHAYHQDMGITTDFVPVEDPNAQHGSVALGDLVPDPELPGSEMLETVAYVRLLAPPRRGRVTAQVEQGASLFAALGCAGCHTPSMRTGPHPIAPLSEVDVPLYSDLLLHDMGDALADDRPDHDATGREWRTAPLWGTRLVREFLAGREFYLHDGRCRDLACAVLAHGGEGAAARDGFAALGDADQRALLAFLRSL